MSEQTVIEAVRATLQSEMLRDDSVIVLGEDVGSRGGVFLATDGLIDQFGENRVIDMPLAESSICGIPGVDRADCTLLLAGRQAPGRSTGSPGCQHFLA